MLRLVVYGPSLCFYEMPVRDSERDDDAGESGGWIFYFYIPSNIALNVSLERAKRDEKLTSNDWWSDFNESYDWEELVGSYCSQGRTKATLHSIIFSLSLSTGPVWAVNVHVMSSVNKGFREWDEQCVWKWTREKFQKRDCTSYEKRWNECWMLSKLEHAEREKKKIKEDVISRRARWTQRKVCATH